MCKAVGFGMLLFNPLPTQERIRTREEVRVRACNRGHTGQNSLSSAHTIEVLGRSLEVRGPLESANSRWGWCPGILFPGRKDGREISKGRRGRWGRGRGCSTKELEGFRYVPRVFVYIPPLTTCQCVSIELIA